ncbi:hypothetical protein Lal_00018898 [Lupinus albus]|nr:hypothetical protein Lal_00018898 [Lupinus albus]
MEARTSLKSLWIINKLLSSFMIMSEFERAKVDITLLRKSYNEDFIVVQTYMDAIIFSAIDESLCQNFAKRTKGLSLSSSKTNKRRVVHPSRKYTKEILMKFKMDDYKLKNTQIHPRSNLNKDGKIKEYY